MSLSKSEQSRLKARYGSWAVITGASSGIGLELVERLAEAGLNLVINARHQEPLIALATRLEASYGISVKPVVADLTQQAAADQLIAASNGLAVGLFVASAGFGTSGSFLDASIDGEVAMLRVNCESLLRLTYHYSKQFVAQKRGGIILMSSMVSFQGVPFAAHYAATKAYVQSLAEALAVEMKPHGVDVLAAAPGPVESGFGLRANMKMSMSLTPAQVGVPILKALGRQSTVLPGTLTKLLVGALRTVPRWAKVLIMKQVMGGMTKHQNQ